MKKQYCKKCGKEMIGRESVGSYDQDTGEPIMYALYFCPEIKNEDHSTEGTYMGHWIYRIELTK